MRLTSHGLHGRIRAGRRTRIVVRPTTRPGTWAVRLAIANVLLVLAWRLLGPLGAFPGFACGLAGGVVGLVAIVGRRERALAVYAALLPLLFVVAFVLA